MKKILLFFLVLQCAALAQSGLARKNDVRDSLNNRLGSNWVTPQMYGAVADGVTDDSEVIQNVLSQGVVEANYKDKKVYFYGSYSIEGDINIDNQNKDLEIKFEQGGKIISNGADSTYFNWYTPHGRLMLKNVDKLIIDGLVLESTNAGDTVSQDNGLLIDNCNEVELRNVKVTRSAYGGIQIRNVSKLTMTNCIFDSNMYAGAILVSVRSGIISGNTFNYNGIATEMPTWGYGITLAQPWGTGLDNKDIQIIGNTANYNYRKGIDIHDGQNITISNNSITGFGYGGIYAVSESGSDGMAFVKDVIISNNIVINDKTWYDVNYTVGAGTQHIIAVGCYDSTESGGSFIVSNNIVDVDTIQNVRAPIISFVNKHGKEIEAIHIKDNIILNTADVDSGYAGILVLGDPGTAVYPRVVNISGNTITGTMPYGIHVAYGKDITINNNVFRGTFYPVSAPCESCLDSTFYVRKGNIYNSILLPDIELSNSYLTSDRYAGNVKKFITTSSDADSINILKIDLEEYDSEQGDNSFMAEVSIHVVKAKQDTFYTGLFRGIISAGKPGSSYIFNSATLEEIDYSAENEIDAPQAVWMGTDSIRYLRIICPDAYSSYSIDIDFNAWRLSPTILTDQDEIDSSGTIGGDLIYGTSTSKTEELETSIQELATSQVIEGWYEDDADTTSSVSELSRGVARYDRKYEVAKFCYLKKLYARVIDYQVRTLVRVYVYRNEQPTGAFINVGNNFYRNELEFGDNVIPFQAGDIIDLRYTFTDLLNREYPISIKAGIELAYPNAVDDIFVNGIEINTEADYGGTIEHYKMVDGSAESAPVYEPGDEVMVIATPPDTSWRFWCWTGVALNNPADRTNDTVYVTAAQSITMKARFHKPQYAGIRVVINQPDGNTDTGNKMKWMFAAGYDDDGEFAAWEQFRANGDSVHVTYYADVEDAYKFCDSVGAEILIEGMYNSRIRTQTLAQTYYPIQTFVPAGGVDSTAMDSTIRTWTSGYPKQIFPAAWVLGTIGYEQAVQGDCIYDPLGCEAVNTTAYDIEFVGYSPSTQTNPAGKWWNVLINTSEPEAQWTPAWSAGLVMLAMDNYGNFVKADGWIDYYGFREMLKYKCADVTDNSRFTWTKSNGYNYIDRSQVDDLTRNTNYVYKTLADTYHFRNLDPYLTR